VVATNGNGSAASLTKVIVGVLGTLVTTAVVAIAAFSVSTSRNVAVLTAGIDNLSRQITALEPRVRKLEDDVTRLQEWRQLSGR
jgi:hypothetical protein